MLRLGDVLFRSGKRGHQMDFIAFLNLIALNHLLLFFYNHLSLSDSQKPKGIRFEFKETTQSGSTRLKSEASYQPLAVHNGTCYSPTEEGAVMRFPAKERNCFVPPTPFPPAPANRRDLSRSRRLFLGERFPKVIQFAFCHSERSGPR